MPPPIPPPERGHRASRRVLGMNTSSWEKRAFPHSCRVKQTQPHFTEDHKDAIRFLLFARRDLNKGRNPSTPLSNTCCTTVILMHSSMGAAPFFAAICTCSYEAVSLPAETIIEFLTSGMLFNGIWRAKHGAEDAIEKCFSTVRLFTATGQYNRSRKKWSRYG